MCFIVTVSNQNSPLIDRTE